jgi:hypothetical protein
MRITTAQKSSTLSHLPNVLVAGDIASSLRAKGAAMAILG